MLRRLGDVSLYKAGFFAGALRDSVVGQGYTIEMGRTAYAQVAGLDPRGLRSRLRRAGPEVPPAGGRAGGHRRPLVCPELSRRSPPGVESWRRTGSETLEGVLVDAGLLPPGGGLPN